MPADLVSHILSFEPDAARAVQAASRTLRHTSTPFMALHARATGALCSPERSNLYSLVHDCFTFYQPHFASNPNRAPVRFLLSVPVCVASLGALPRERNISTFLATREIERYNQRIEDANLDRIWPVIRATVTAANPALVPPAVMGPIQNIRTWMHANQDELQGIQSLNLVNRDLTCVPLEIGLFTGLHTLNLSSNQLT
jgi:hypothetical protein